MEGWTSAAFEVSGRLDLVLSSPMADFPEEQAKRLYGLGELEGEALEVLRLVVQQTERGENLDAALVERAKAIVERYDRVMMRGHESAGVIPLRRD